MSQRQGTCASCYKTVFLENSHRTSSQTRTFYIQGRIKLKKKHSSTTHDFNKGRNAMRCPEENMSILTTKFDDPWTFTARTPWHQNTHPIIFALYWNPSQKFRCLSVLSKLGYLPISVSEDITLWDVSHIHHMFFVLSSSPHGEGVCGARPLVFLGIFFLVLSAHVAAYWIKQGHKACLTLGVEDCKACDGP